MIVQAKSKDEAFKIARELASEKANDLELKKKTKVNFYLFIVSVDGEDYDFADAYMTEPNRQSKMGAIDMIYGARPTAAGENLWFANKIEDASDVRIESDDELYMGLIHELFTEVQFKGAALKKN